MKFAMGADTLTVLTKATSGSSDDLSVLVRQLFEAAEPLEGRFQGAGRAAFDRFKGRTDAISAELKASLDGVLGGIGGMNRSFLEGESAMVDQTQSLEAGSSFDAAGPSYFAPDQHRKKRVHRPITSRNRPVFDRYAHCF